MKRDHNHQLHAFSGANVDELMGSFKDLTAGLSSDDLNSILNMFGGAGSPAASSGGTTTPDLTSILNLFGGARSPVASAATTAAAPSLTAAASTLANMASAVRSTPAGGLLASLGSGTPGGNLLSTLLQGGSQATTATASGAPAPTQRAGLLTQLHESLGKVDTLFDFPQVQDLLSGGVVIQGCVRPACLLTSTSRF